MSGQAAAAQPAKPKDGREKITLLISKETNVKLSTLAALKGVDRSTLADSILTEALRDVVISLRGARADGAGEGDKERPEGGEVSAARRVAGDANLVERGKPSWESKCGGGGVSRQEVRRC